MSDEFSGSTLSSEWAFVGGEKASARTERGKLIITAQGADEAFLLKCARAEDWQLETKMETSPGRGQGYFHGLILHADESNYMIWGKTAEQTALCLCRGGEKRILFTGPDDPFIKIRKVTRGAACATYYFYSNHIYSGMRHWRYRGCYRDEDHFLDQARYGFYGTGREECASVYDYIAENILDYDLSNFPDLGEVDGVWAKETEKAHVMAAGGSLQAEFLSDGAVPVIMRPPIASDFRILTMVNQPRLRYGLMLRKAEGDYLLLCANSAWICQSGHAARLYENRKNDPWLRITKKGREYILETSPDGMNFAEKAVFLDEGDLLCDSQYGIGGLDMKKQIAGVKFIREMHAPDGMIWDIAQYRQMGRLIGAPQDHPLNDSYSMARLRSGDEGNLTDTGDRVYMMLGDSFSGNGTHSSDWRSNVLAIVDGDRPEENLRIKEILTDERGMMRELIAARRMDYDEVTCIPSHGVCVNGILYYHYISVYHWGIGAHWDCNHAGWAWTADGGETWQRKEPFFPAESNFMYSSLLRKDGYVYIYGIPSGKFGGVKLGRVPEESILEYDAYSYFAGLDEAGQPIWVKTEAEAILIVDDQVSEFSVSYNEGLDRYLMTYANQYTSCLVIRDAESLWGPWSHANILREYETDSLFHYGPYMLDRYIRENGRRLYFVATNSYGYYLTWNSVKLITRENGRRIE